MDIDFQALDKIDSKASRGPPKAFHWMLRWTWSPDKSDIKTRDEFVESGNKLFAVLQGVLALHPKCGGRIEMNLESTDRKDGGQSSTKGENLHWQVYFHLGSVKGTEDPRLRKARLLKYLEPLTNAIYVSPCSDYKAVLSYCMKTDETYAGVHLTSVKPKPTNKDGIDPESGEFDRKFYKWDGKDPETGEEMHPWKELYPFQRDIMRLLTGRRRDKCLVIRDTTGQAGFTSLMSKARRDPLVSMLALRPASAGDLANIVYNNSPRKVYIIDITRKTGAQHRDPGDLWSVVEGLLDGYYINTKYLCGVIDQPPAMVIIKTNAEFIDLDALSEGRMTLAAMHTETRTLSYAYGPKLAGHEWSVSAKVYPPANREPWVEGSNTVRALIHGVGGKRKRQTKEEKLAASNITLPPLAELEEEDVPPPSKKKQRTVSEMMSDN
nr:putative replication associated protein [Crucivirus sp.]